MLIPRASSKPFHNLLTILPDLFCNPDEVRVSAAILLIVNQGK